MLILSNAFIFLICIVCGGNAFQGSYNYNNIKVFFLKPYQNVTTDTYLILPLVVCKWEIGFEFLNNCMHRYELSSKKKCINHIYKRHPLKSSIKR